MGSTICAVREECTANEMRGGLAPSSVQTSLSIWETFCSLNATPSAFLKVGFRFSAGWIGN